MHICDSRWKPPIQDVLDAFILLFTYPYPSPYPRFFKNSESVKVREGSVKGSVKGKTYVGKTAVT